MTSLNIDNAPSLEEVLKESIRVRNLLARTPDESFHRILHAVLRPCLRRLDEISMAVYSPTNDVDETENVTMRRQIQGHTIGSLAHAMQRLRCETITGDALWLHEASRELAQSQSSITRTLAIALMDAGIPLTFSSLSPCLPHLIAFLDARYQNVLWGDPTNAETAAQEQLASTSWVLVDLLAHHSGMKCFHDWERDTYIGVDHPPWNRTMEAATEAAATVVTQDGAGTFDLFMDILLFWPATKHIPEQEDNCTGMSIAGLDRMNHRCKEGAVWNEIYLRHLKYAIAKYALGVPDHRPNGLLRQQRDRAILLAVLAATSNSMHGRLACSFVAQAIGPHAFDETRVSPKGISWSLAISLLILILGDEMASAVTAKYPKARHIWEPLLGPRSASPRYRRAPLPPGVSNRIVSFLRVNVDMKCVLDSLDKVDVDFPAVSLYLDLVVRTQDPGRVVFWGIDLLKPVFSELRQNPILSERIKRLLCSKLLETAVAALETVPPSKTLLVEELHAPEHVLPLGVPADFSDRVDLNGLLHKHRTTQRRRALLSYEAMEARKGAYQMIADCIRFAGVPEEDPISVPIALFQCIASEDRGLSPAVADSLKTILLHFKDARFHDSLWDEQNKRTFIAPLIPSLICAVASDSVDSSKAAEEWVKEFLVDLDGEISSIFLNFLTPGVVSPAPRTARNGETSESAIRFLDLGLPSSMNEVLCSILGRVKQFSYSTRTSPALSLALLQKFDFSLEVTRKEYKIDKRIAIRDVGMLHRAGMEHADLSSQSTCRICFNDFGSGFALSCGHRFCTDCWKDYLRATVPDQGARSPHLTCPDHKCDEALSIFEVERIDPRAGKRLCMDLVSAFVESDPKYAFCPKAGCQMVACRQTRQRQVSTTCESCAQEFCFDCGGLPHRPAACKDLTRWNQIFGSSSFWIKKNAKPCPSCAAPIEKTSGCNHIRCRQCGADWCWICLRYLRSHMEAHACNRYSAITEAEAEEEERSIFFTDRYQAHEEAEAVAKQRAEFIQNHRNEIKDGLWYAGEPEIELYISTFALLVGARSFLKYSFVAAWSLDEDALKVFQDLQAILEVATENLTQMTMSRLDDVYAQKGYAGMQFVFRSIHFHSSIVRECMDRLKVVMRLT